MAQVYSQTTQNTYSNFNWNANNDRYAWSFVASENGSISEIALFLNGIVGTPTGEIYIRSDKTADSVIYSSATGITFTSGTNYIKLTPYIPLISGETYWIFFVRTSNSSNYPQFQYDSTKANYPVYRATSANTDPTTLWFTNDIKMQLFSELHAGLGDHWDYENNQNDSFGSNTGTATNISYTSGSAKLGSYGQYFNGTNATSTLPIVMGNTGTWNMWLS